MVELTKKVKQEMRDNEIKDLASKALNKASEPCTTPDCAQPRAVPDIQEKIGSIAAKVPTLDALEHKLDLMNDLHPELKSLVRDLNDITNFEDMTEARKGGEVIKKALEKQS